MKVRFFFFIFFLHFILGFSQDQNGGEGVVELKKSDTVQLEKNQDSIDQDILNLPIYPKSLQDKFREKYKSSDFDYHSVKPSPSFFERLINRILNILESVLGKMDPASTGKFVLNFFRLIGIIIIGLVLYSLIRFLMKKNGNFFFSRKNKPISVDTVDVNENIHEIDFQQGIVQFEAVQDYRSAVRYHFLSVLKKMDDRKVLTWNPEKTNRDYISEVQNPSVKDRFRDLVYIFDYVWYGEFTIDENAYRVFKKKFLDFKN